MVMTHYFPNYGQNGIIPIQELFALITEYGPQEQQALASKLLCNPGRALRRFERFNDYMQKRIQTEQWLYSAFLAIGGKPVSQYPFYFVLGQSEGLKCDFGPNAGELILDTAQISACDLSFTLGDSMGLYFSDAPKKLYSLNEIESISINTVFVQKQMLLLEPHHRYIEVQLWDKHYLSAAQIIRDYPLFFQYTTLSKEFLVFFASIHIFQGIQSQYAYFLNCELVCRIYNSSLTSFSLCFSPISSRRRLWGIIRIAIGKSSEMHRNTSGIHCGIMNTVPYCVKRLDYQVVWPFLRVLSRKEGCFCRKNGRISWGKWGWRICPTPWRNCRGR